MTVKIFNLGRRRAYLIYDKIISIVAEKPGGQRYIHNFTTKSKVWGLDNGMILIASPFKLKLWGEFVTTTDDIRKLHDSEQDSVNMIIDIDDDGEEAYTVLKISDDEDTT